MATVDRGRRHPRRTRVRRAPSRDLALEVFDFDYYSQALSKIERGFELDLEDVEAMISGGLVEPGRLQELFAQIESELYRFPAVDPEGLRAGLTQALRRHPS